jgi:outer membrane lipoprotein-sorting protein
VSARRFLGVLLSLAASCVVASAVDAAGPEAITRTLARKLKAGAATVSFERVAKDPLSGEAVRARGTLALEPPDRAALRFAATGERVTLRGDGGEWLQPSLEQLVRFDRARAHGALRWWQLLLGGADDAFTALQRGPRTWTVVARAADGAPADSARVRLGADGLPDRIEVDEGLGAVATYTLSGWRFGAARGRAAFVIAPPKGYEVVALP